MEKPYENIAEVQEELLRIINNCPHADYPVQEINFKKVYGI